MPVTPVPNITVVSSPFSVNATTNNLPFVVTSPDMTKPQYRLVTDIYIPERSSDSILRVKTFPSASVCMIDIARIAADYLTYDTPMTIPNGTGSYANAAQFRILMGEEYSDSPSGSIVLYDGNGTAGDPAFVAAFSGSINGTLLPAVNEYSNLTYDWPESEWYADINGVNSTPFLTNDPNYTLSGIVNASPAGTPTKKAYDYDWETISLITDGTYNEGFDVEATIWTGSLFVAPVVTISSYYDTSVARSLAPLHHVGIGPANISASNSSSAQYIASGSWSKLRYDFTMVSGDNRIIEIYREDCDNYYDQNLAKIDPYDNTERFIKGRTRFAFINKYGVMDYYNVNNPALKTARIKREDYTQPQLPWQTLNTSSGAVFNAGKRGKDTYQTSYINKFEVTTDYMDQEHSDWLTELIESPSVWIQGENLNNQSDMSKTNYFEERAAIQNGFYPINISNASYTWKTNKWSQKLFQYDIKWEMSNLAETRR
tara:strand:+ start:1666 stop:3123 length:1458 start_codon:yes stop_codon:yes gene_type:complete